MGILDVEDRIVLALLDDFGEVEIERRVVLAHQHDEPDGVDADLVHDFAQGDEVPGALGHFDRLAGAHQPHELTKAHIELALPSGQRRDRRLHPLDIAAVVGAPDVDQRQKAAIDLVL